MLSGHDLLSVASQRKQELMQILAQCHLSPDMYPLIPGHAMRIVEGIGDYTFTSPYDFDGSFSSHKQMRKMLKEELAVPERALQQQGPAPGPAGPCQWPGQSKSCQWPLIPASGSDHGP